MSVTIDSAYKSRHIKALIRLSRASGLYPECLVLQGINIEGDAVAGGGFGDVYKGHLQGQEIAIKILRVYQKSDMDKLLKVIHSSLALCHYKLMVFRNSHLRLLYGDNYLTQMSYHSMVFII